MWILNLLLTLLLQAPSTSVKVVVGLIDGQQVVVENPEFSGFIQGRSTNAVLIYRHDKVHGEMPTATISKIEFGAYKRREPFAMTVTLKNGLKLDVQSERNNFVSLTGKTDIGMVTIKHPDPNSTWLRLSTKKPNRAKDLTIQYLEFPAS
jgi:hypothetical protein